MTEIATTADALDFAEQWDYPVIIKPRDAAGASGTYRANNRDELKSVAGQVRDLLSKAVMSV